MKGILLLVSLVWVANGLSEKDPHPDFHHNSKVVFTDSTSAAIPRNHHSHPLPPVAMPGILKEFDNAAIRRKRMFLSNLRTLQNHRMLNDNMIRTRRGLMFLPRKTHKPIKVRRNKRDLRRLTRDLSHEMRSHLPSYLLEKRQLGVPQESPYSQSQDMDMETLLANVDLLDRLALLKQVSQYPDYRPMEVPKNHYHRHIDAPRFAPQPMLYQGMVSNRQAPPRQHTQAMQNVYNGERWVQQKRSRQGGLSRVPGFKRSAFREAERMNPKTEANPKNADEPMPTNAENMFM